MQNNVNAFLKLLLSAGVLHCRHITNYQSFACYTEEPSCFLIKAHVVRNSYVFSSCLCPRTASLLC